MHSSMDNIVVNEAAASSRKNMAASTEPRGILPKAIGRVTKIRPGPLSGSRPKANTKGNMIRPAINATRVSALAIINDIRGIEISCFM